MHIRNKILKNFEGDELATDVFMGKYALKDNDNNILETSLSDSKNRLIEFILQCESDKEKYKKEYEFLMKYFISAGRILYAGGNYYVENASLSNCYYIPIPEDSIEGIYQAAAWQARIFSYGGGVGLDITKLRPKGAKVNNSAKTTSGAVSFMDLFSANTGLIGQYGRRGATIITLDISHPDIIEFIQVKGGKDKSKVQYANISIKITNKFMEQLFNDPTSEWEMKYELKSGKEIIKKEKIQIIWDLIIQSNWLGAEPGILFWDNILTNYASVFDETRPEGVNPCAEQNLAPWSSCNLGSINLSKLVKKPFTDKAEFDFESFKKTIELSIRFLSHINKLNIDRQPLEQLKNAIRIENKVGLGGMGLADMLIKLNLKYDTEEAICFIEKLHIFLKDISLKTSIDLAEEFGMCKILEKYKDTDKWNEFINHPYFNDLSEDYKEKLNMMGLYNIGLLNYAPTGSISIIERCSSGIEPIFALSYDRKVKETGKNNGGGSYKVYHPLVEEYNSIFGENAHLKNINFITAEEIDWRMRIKLQSTIQKYITDSSSSTINLSSDTTKETISEIYKEAYKQKLKGITIYRDGSRDNILKKNTKFEVLDSYKFPNESVGKLKIIRSEGRKWYVWYTIDNETELPNSLFVNTNSSETNILTEDVLDHLIKIAKKYIKNVYLEKLLENVANRQPNVVKISRVIGMLLRHRVPIIEIIKNIEEIKPPVYSFIFQIKKLLGEYLPENTLTGDKCPDCDSLLIFESGCSICKNCGFSACG